MRFSLALFATSALASSLVSRQATGLPADIAAIQAKTEALTTAIEAYQGEVTQALAVNGAAGEVNDAVQAATTTANGLSEIAQNDAIALVNPIQDLAKAVNTSVTALIGKKDLFTTAGLDGAVLSTLQTQSKASQALSDAIVSKLPAGLQGTGANLAKPIADSFAAGTSPSATSYTPEPYTGAAMPTAAAGLGAVAVAALIAAL
ncbi:Cell wall mannoprotein 1 [Pseudocercospora fuligena]|uniref:Cell wall mannoprotein 1 n=1 Tax=Pseudocercospora fuligena TaxID=685502 RepID=A0A8H6VQ46_9PEZI|nr:Cell wall mannoprotein 1 [Pseudocercospora fuligena]